MGGETDTERERHLFQNLPGRLQGRADIADQVWRPFGGRIASSSGDFSLFSLKASNEFGESHPIMESNLLYGKSSALFYFILFYFILFYLFFQDFV